MHTSQHTTRDFVTGYCNQRFGEAWHLNPELSLELRSGERTLPRQTIIWATGANNQIVSLPHGSSLVLYRAPRLLPAEAAKTEAGLRLAALEHALVAVSERFFVQEALAAQLVLRQLPDSIDLARVLLAGSHSVIAGRLAGGLRAIGRTDEAEDLVRAMRAGGFDVREVNPFERPPRILRGSRQESPYAQRLRLLWEEMRNAVIASFPPPSPSRLGSKALLEDIEARYVADAYHSLSIEGYRVVSGDTVN